MKPRQLAPLADRGPLRVMFVITSMPVGGAETLLVNLIRRMDRERFAPELCCLKTPGPLGEMLRSEVPVFSGLLGGKYDLRIAWRLPRLLRRRRIDAVVTVGAGDKMFWGRLAAWRAHTPVVASALHSTGWPDGIGRLNRKLTRITDAFIAVAAPHGEHLATVEGFPREKIRVIANGVDTDRFRPVADASATRRAIGLAGSDRAVGIVAALRPEKNHELLLRAMAQLKRRMPEARLVVVGDGPCRGAIETLARELGIERRVLQLGTRSDIPAMLAAIDVFALSSHMEANPVSILEALSCGKPVVATNVGSVSQTVRDGETGFLVSPGNAEEMASRLYQLLDEPALAERMGMAGRRLVEREASLGAMVRGYEALLEDIYQWKAGGGEKGIRRAVDALCPSAAGR